MSFETKTRIITETVGPVKPKPEEKLDLQDALVISGIVLAEACVALFSWKLAIGLGAVLCFVFAFLIQRTKAQNVRRAGGHPLIMPDGN
jgi:hypothetical protein